MKTLLAGLLALFLFVTPAAAQECASLSDVVGTLEGDGTKYVVLEPEAVQGFVDDVAEPVLGGDEIEGVTNVLVAALNGAVVFGLEIDGCIVGPFAIPGVSVMPARLSGRMPDGSTHA